MSGLAITAAAGEPSRYEPTFALKELTAAEEARISALVKKAVSED